MTGIIIGSIGVGVIIAAIIIFICIKFKADVKESLFKRRDHRSSSTRLRQGSRSSAAATVPPPSRPPPPPLSSEPPPPSYTQAVGSSYPTVDVTSDPADLKRPSHAPSVGNSAEGNSRVRRNAQPIGAGTHNVNEQATSGLPSYEEIVTTV